MIRYRLRTLLIVLALGPPVLWGCSEANDPDLDYDALAASAA